MLSGIRSFSPLVRAVFVIGAVAALVSSITFAVLSDTATLAGSTMSTTNAELQIYDFTEPTPGWKNSAPGFAFNNLVPGTFSSPSSFYLKNAGGVNMNITAHVPDEPTVTGDLSIDWTTKVKITITGEACSPPVTTDLAALLAGEVALPCNPLNAGATGHSGIPGTAGNYNIKVNVEADAVSGSGPIVINAFDIIFTGTQVTPVVPS